MNTINSNNVIRHRNMKVYNPKANFKEEGNKVLMQLGFETIDNHGETLLLEFPCIELNDLTMKFNEDCDECEPYAEVLFKMRAGKEGEFVSYTNKKRYMTLKEIEKELGYKVQIIG